MVGFAGAFEPLPIRHGGRGPDLGWTAEQGSRTAADLCAIVRTAAYARVTVTFDASTFAVNSYTGANGNGSAFNPTGVIHSEGDATITFPAVWADEFENVHRFNIDQARATAHASTFANAVHEITGANTVRVRVFDADGVLLTGTVKIALKVWCPRGTKIGDYGGSLRKRNSDTEGSVPYAWAMYRELQGIRGSAFSTDANTLVHCENLAMARMLGWAWFRMPEKIENEATPGNSSQLLGDWTELLDVVTLPGETASDLRIKCRRKDTGVNDAEFSSLHDGVAELLGDWLVALELNRGATLDSPPAGTYWPGVNDGAAAIDLGGGTWTSARAHIWVLVRSPMPSEEPEFLALMNIELNRYLGWRLPSTCTFDWAISDGFVVGTSSLGYAGFGA